MQRRRNRSSGLVMTSVLLLLIGAVALFLLLSSLGEEETHVVVPTVPPTIVLAATASSTPSSTASLTPSPTASYTLAPSPTPPPPSSTPEPTLIPPTPQPDLPPLPARVEIALGISFFADGIPPSYGRFGGLYDNSALIQAGHVMLTVPGDASLPTFHIDAFEVTNLQLVNFLNATQLTQTPLAGWDANAHWIDSPELEQDENGLWQIKNQQKARLPARGVSALAARAYCANLEGSLPTLAQWERAAFWINGALYPWGDTPPDRSFVNFAGDAPTTRDSMDKGRSWIGAFHMVGNVAEWIQLEEGNFGLIGGSFLDDGASFEDALHTPQRLDPSLAPPEAGFRCVRN